MISALLHNVAAFRAGNLKLADALGSQLREEARRAMMEATSAAAYDHSIGTSSLAQFIPHVTAQLLIVEKRYEEAKDEMVPRAIKALESSMDKDDIVYVSCRLATIYAALGQELSVAEAQMTARDQMAAFRSVQEQLVRTLARVAEELPEPNKFEHK